MGQPPPRRRAPGMTPERRREMIVQVALPLLAEYGSGVTTSQIARAAGIGEATIFRAFADKDELLDACVAEVLRPDHVLEQIAAIPLDQPLPARLEEAATAMEAHMTRLGTVLAAVTGPGRRPPTRRANAALDRNPPAPDHRPGGVERHDPEGAERDPGGACEPDGAAQGPRGVEYAPGDAEPASDDARRGPGDDGREVSFRRTQEALAELFEPERASLRLPPDQLAGIFLGFVFTLARKPRGPDAPVPSLRDFLDVFLHGALSKEGES